MKAAIATGVMLVAKLSGVPIPWWLVPLPLATFGVLWLAIKVLSR